MKKTLASLAIVSVSSVLLALGTVSASAITLPKPPVAKPVVVVGCPAGYHKVWTFTNGMAFYKCVKN